MRVSDSTLDVLAALLAAGSAGSHVREAARRADRAPGTTAPILARLETLGWATSQWDDRDPSSRGPRRRVYQLTPEGADAARALLAKGKQS